MKVPYSITELEIVAKQHNMNIYHKELMEWAIKRIKELESEVDLLNCEREEQRDEEESRD